MNKNRFEIKNMTKKKKKIIQIPLAATFLSFFARPIMECPIMLQCLTFSVNCDFNY